MAMAVATSLKNGIKAISTSLRLMPLLWTALAIGVLVEALGSVLHLGGNRYNIIFSDWLHDSLMVAAALLILWRVVRHPDRDCRAGWTAIGLGYFIFAIGDVLWSLLYSRVGVEPDHATVSDVLYLLWYPFMFVGIGLLVRDRVPHFELNRLIDGIVVMLVVATPGVALVLQPVVERTSRADPLGRAVDIAPAFGDVLLLGAVLGVYGLMAWRPGRAWILIGLSLGMTAAADAVFAVQAAGGHYREGVYDFVWTAGAVLLAYAAWLPAPGKLKEREAFGWRAILLPVTAQALGVAIQIYGYFREIPSSERIVTVAVLLIATVQIIASRPRRGGRPPIAASSTSAHGTGGPQPAGRSPGLDGGASRPEDAARTGA